MQSRVGLRVTEGARRLARYLVGQDTAFYKFGAGVFALVALVESEGVANAV